MTRRNLYIALSAVIAALVIHAWYRTAVATGIEDDWRDAHAPSFTEQQYTAEFTALRNLPDPQNSEQYFIGMGRMDRMDAYLRKAARRHFRYSDPRIITNYDLMALGTIKSNWAIHAQRLTNPSREDFDKHSQIFIKETNAYDAGLPEDQRQSAVKYWLLVWLVPLPIVLLLYRVKVRERGMKFWLDVISNWKLPVALALWPWGLTWYPKGSPASQLKAAYRLGGLVFSAAISCFGAGNGKICKSSVHEERPEGTNTSETVHYRFSTITLPEYLGLDGGVFFPKAVQQSSLTAAFPGGAYLNFWNSTALAGRGSNPDFGNELDYTAGWGGKACGLNLDFALTYLDVSPLGHMPRGDVIQMTTYFGKPLQFKRSGNPKRSNTVEPYLWIFKALAARGESPHGGTLIHFGSRYSVDGISIPRLPQLGITASTEAVHDPGAFGFNPGYIGRATVEANWRLSPHVTLQAPAITMSAPLTQTGDGRKFQFVFGAGLAFGW